MGRLTPEAVKNLEVIAKLDEKACVYIMNNVPIEKWECRLSTMFGWHNTPQGHHYWALLSDKIHLLKKGEA
jgi:hypothetical protein